MFKLRRNKDNCSMGFWQYQSAGRPKDDSERVWIHRCNFVVYVIATTTNIDTSNQSSGWIARIVRKHNAKLEHFDICIDCATAANTSLLRKTFMKRAPGLVARLTSEDFFEFIELDSQRNKLKNIFISNRVGCIWVQNRQYWAFSNIVLDSKGMKIDHSPVMVDVSSPYSCSSMLSNGSRLNKTSIKRLGDCTRKYFKSRSVHALHVYSTTLKAVLKHNIEECEHMLSVTNISGPANIGKTFACCIALRMMGADDLMLSRVTPSSLLDVCDHHCNMLCVWDDPRDATHKQLASIVHEAFHGFPNTTVSKGVRKYNSAIIIGTQHSLLGLQNLPMHTPTFSRLAHIDMSTTEFKIDSTAGDQLARCMEGLEDIFSLLLSINYTKKVTDDFYAKLVKKAGDAVIIDRALRVAAIEWNLCTQMNNLGFGFDAKQIEEYFCNHMLGFLKLHCNRMTPLHQFVKDCKENFHAFESTDIKMNVYAELKCTGTCECVSVHVKSIFAMLKAIKGSLNYTVEGVQSEVKDNKEYGELSHNVSYKSKNSFVTRRSMVIRKSIWDKFV